MYRAFVPLIVFLTGTAGVGAAPPEWPGGTEGAAVQQHLIDPIGDLVAVDLQHGAGTAALHVERIWSGAAVTGGSFGPGWADLNVVRLTQNASQSIVIRRGGLVWLRADPEQDESEDDEQQWLTPDGGTFTRQADGWVAMTPDRWQLRFDEGGRLQTAASPFQTVVRYEYDSQGRLLSVAHGDKNRLQYLYDDAAGAVRRITGPENLVVEYEYDGSGRLARAVTARRIAVVYEYSSTGQLQTVRDQFGNSMTAPFAPDQISEDSTAAAEERTGTSTTDEAEPQDADVEVSLLGRAGSVASPVRLPELTFDERGLLTTSRLGSRTASWFYDERGRLVRHEDPAGTESYEHDKFGRVIGIRDAAGEHRLQYNAYDQPVRITSSDGSWQAFEYDDFGRILTQSDSTGFWQQFEYDEAGRLAAVKSRPGTEARYHYDAEGRVTRIAVADGNEVTLEYDRVDRVTGESWKSGARQTWQYDDDGNLVQWTDTDGVTTEYRFDDDGRMREQVDPLRGKITWDDADGSSGQITLDWDGLGSWSSDVDIDRNPAKLLEPGQRVTRFSYDDARQLIGVRLPSARAWQFEYDGAERLSVVQSPSGRTSSAFRYDEQGRITEISRHGVPWRRYEYSPRGWLASEHTRTGRAAAYEYDEAGRPVVIQLPEGEARMQYNDDGGLQQVAGPDYRVAQQFHPDGTLRQREYQPAGLVVELPVDDVGRSAGVRLNQLAATYEYDERGRVQRIALPYDQSIELKRDARGQLTQLAYSTGLKTGFSWDPAGRLLSVGALSEDQELVFLESYQYSPRGNLTRIETQGGPGQTHAYDDDRRLVTTASGDTSPTVRYEYDVDDNLVSWGGGTETHQWDLDAAGRPAFSDDHVSFEWDSAGNLIGMWSPQGSARNAFCVAGRLRQRDTAQGSWEFAYLPDGDRLYQRDAAGTTWYAYLPEALVGWKDAANVTWLLVCLPGTDWPLAACGSDGTFLPIVADRLGSIRRVVDVQGTLIGQCDYGPYGQTTRDVGEMPLRMFAGMLVDGYGLMYARERYYDPALLRFISVDPLVGSGEMPISHNAYAYASNNPLRYRDPMGSRSSPSKMAANLSLADDEQLNNWMKAIDATLATQRVGYEAKEHLVNALTRLQDEVRRRSLLQTASGNVARASSAVSSASASFSPSAASSAAANFTPSGTLVNRIKPPIPVMQQGLGQAMPYQPYPGYQGAVSSASGPVNTARLPVSSAASTAPGSQAVSGASGSQQALSRASTKALSGASRSQQAVSSASRAQQAASSVSRAQAAVSSASRSQAALSGASRTSQALGRASVVASRGAQATSWLSSAGSALVKVGNVATAAQLGWQIYRTAQAGSELVEANREIFSNRQAARQVEQNIENILRRAIESNSIALIPYRNQPRVRRGVDTAEINRRLAALIYQATVNMQNGRPWSQGFVATTAGSEAALANAESYVRRAELLLARANREANRFAGIDSTLEQELQRVKPRPSSGGPGPEAQLTRNIEQLQQMMTRVKNEVKTPAAPAAPSEPIWQPVARLTEKLAKEVCQYAAKCEATQQPAETVAKWRESATSKIRAIVKAIDAAKQKVRETEEPNRRARNDLAVRVEAVKASIKAVEKELEAARERDAAITRINLMLPAYTAAHAQLVAAQREFLTFRARVYPVLGQLARFGPLPQTAALQARLNSLQLVNNQVGSDPAESIRSIETYCHEFKTKLSIEIPALAKQLREAGRVLAEAEELQESIEGPEVKKERLAAEETRKNLEQAMKCYSKITTNLSSAGHALGGIVDQAPDVDVPNLLGLPAQEARQQADDAGFVAQFHVGKPAGKKDDVHHVYGQNPQAGSRSFMGATLDLTIYADMPGGGFQAGDGAGVDARFASAKITDGELLMEGAGQFTLKLPGSGKNTVIMATNRESFLVSATAGSGVPKDDYYWSIKKYQSGDHASQVISKLAEVYQDARPGTYEYDGSFHRLRKTVQGGRFVLDITGSIASHRQLDFSTYVCAEKYRDVFVIVLARVKNQANHNYAPEEAKIVSQSKRLVDVRFP